MQSCHQCRWLQKRTCKPWVWAKTFETNAALGEQDMGSRQKYPFIPLALFGTFCVMDDASVAVFSCCLLFVPVQQALLAQLFATM